MTTTGSGVVITGTNDVVEVQFVYNVVEKATKFVTVTSNTSIAGGQNLLLDGQEDSAASSKFKATIAVFENSDFSKIVFEAENSANDDSTSDPKDGVQVSELDKNDGLGEELFTRVKLAALELMGGDDAGLASV